MTNKRVIVHPGYHATGAGLLQLWMARNAGPLRGCLGVLGKHGGETDALAATVETFVTTPRREQALDEAACRLADAIRARDEPVVCVTDERLLGPPPGFESRHYREGDIYPRACRIMHHLAGALAEFQPVFVVFERNLRMWLRECYGLTGVGDAVATQLAIRFEQDQPGFDWPLVRHDLEHGIGTAGTLVPLDFFHEFQSRKIADMRFFEILGLPPEVVQKCSPRLA